MSPAVATAADARAETDSHAGFFDALPPLASARDAFDTARYRPAPDDWCLAATDIVGSTEAIASGRHKTVNFIAAAAIAALKNLCAPQAIPFLFGGDGAVVLVPPRHAEGARRELARLRGVAQREFGLGLRAGLVSVAALRRAGRDVRVGRYEPTPGNTFGLFAGGGVSLLEAALKGREDADAATAALGEALRIDPALDDGTPVDLSGLSCRWDPIRSARGQMLTVILHGASDAGAEFAQVMRLAAQQPEDALPRPVTPALLGGRWPPKDFWLEAKARRRGGPLLLAAARVLAETLLAWAVLRRGRPVGRFDPQAYRAEIATNTDFCRYDDTVCFVIDCETARIGPIREHLERESARGRFRYGLDVSDTALMTCLVGSLDDGRHVHFVDGGGGGYTNAARTLKRGRTAAGSVFAEEPRVAAA